MYKFFEKNYFKLLLSVFSGCYEFIRSFRLIFSVSNGALVVAFI
jgi:hypothetical protein